MLSLQLKAKETNYDGMNTTDMHYLRLLPAVYGYFFIPNYPSDIATVNFDRSGTTVIGKYLLNHSFMMPGLICVFTSTIVAYVLSMIIY